MPRKKLSEEEKKRRRKTNNQKYYAKNKPNNSLGLDQHPNAFANLATPELRKRYSKELEDGIVTPIDRSSIEYDIDYDPDEDFRGLKLDDEEENRDRFDDKGDETTKNESPIKPMEEHSTSTTITDDANHPSSPSSNNPPVGLDDDSPPPRRVRGSIIRKGKLSLNHRV
jgi:hypothetical protein